MKINFEDVRYQPPYAHPSRCDVMTDDGDLILSSVDSETCDAWFEANAPHYDGFTHRCIAVGHEPLSVDVRPAGGTDD